MRAATLFESPKYILLVRHPSAVIESFLRGRYDRLIGPRLFKEADPDPYVVAETIWATSNRNLLQFLAMVKPERQYLVHYEELVSDPVRVMSGLCRFLGVAFDEAVLHPYDGQHKRMSGGVGDVGDPNFLQHTRIDPSRGEAWKKINLPRLLDDTTRELALRLGYELPVVETLAPPAPNPVDEEQLLASLAAVSDAEVSAMLGELEEG